MKKKGEILIHLENIWKTNNSVKRCEIKWWQKQQNDWGRKKKKR